VPDVPADLAGLSVPQVDVPAPDLPGALHGLDVPDYSGITQGIPGMDPMQGFRVDVPDVWPASYTMPDVPFSVSLDHLGLTNQRPSENIIDKGRRANFAAEIDPQLAASFPSGPGVISGLMAAMTGPTYDRTEQPRLTTGSPTQTSLRGCIPTIPTSRRGSTARFARRIFPRPRM
jgi:hypothetical protein